MVNDVTKKERALKSRDIDLHTFTANNRYRRFVITIIVAMVIESSVILFAAIMFHSLTQ